MLYALLVPPSGDDTGTVSQATAPLAVDGSRLADPEAARGAPSAVRPANSDASTRYVPTRARPLREEAAKADELGASHLPCQHAAGPRADILAPEPLIFSAE